MPVVKNLNVCPDLCGDSFRRREFLMQKDFIRRFEMNREVSIRTNSMKGMAVIETLRSISEPEVEITQEVQEAYANAEDWLCRRMCNIFQTVRGLGFQPGRPMGPIQFYQERQESPWVIEGHKVVWIPTAAYYVGDERVYLFRTAPAAYAKAAVGKLDMFNTGGIGYTRDYLPKISEELYAYITKLESKAMQDSAVTQAFTRLGGLLRPQQFKQEQLEERAKIYSEVEDFGGWA